jgi:hypothetical protein
MQDVMRIEGVGRFVPEASTDLARFNEHKEVLVRVEIGGAGENRTHDRGFADLGLTTWRPRRILQLKPYPKTKSPCRYRASRNGALPNQLGYCLSDYTVKAGRSHRGDEACRSRAKSGSRCASSIFVQPIKAVRLIERTIEQDSWRSSTRAAEVDQLARFRSFSFRCSLKVSTSFITAHSLWTGFPAAVVFESSRGIGLPQITHIRGRAVMTLGE